MFTKRVAEPTVPPVPTTSYLTASCISGCPGRAPIDGAFNVVPTPVLNGVRVVVAGPTCKFVGPVIEEAARVSSPAKDAVIG